MVDEDKNKSIIKMMKLNYWKSQNSNLTKIYEVESDLEDYADDEGEFMRKEPQKNSTMKHMRVPT